MFLGISVYGSLVPFEFVSKSLREVWQDILRLDFLNLRPDSPADWVANLLLFVPIGFLGLGVLRMDRRPAMLATMGAFIVTLGGALLTSAALELAQLWCTGRTSSPRDVVAQTVGAAVGATLWSLCGMQVVARLRQVFGRVDAGERLDSVLCIVASFHLFASVLPLDLTIHPRELWHKIQSDRFNLTPLACLREASIELYFQCFLLVVMSALVGWLASRLYKRSTGHRLDPLRALLLAVTFSVALEALQLFVYSRTCDIDDVIFGSCGFVLGALCGPLAMQNSARFHSARLVVWLCYTSTVIALYLYPFTFNGDVFQERAADFLRIPFQALYAGAYMHGFEQVLRKTMLFAGLALITGTCIHLSRQAGPARWFAQAAVFAFATSAGVLIELVQIGQPHHLADLTDVLLYGVGSCAGVCVWSFLHPPLFRPAKTVPVHRTSGSKSAAIAGIHVSKVPTGADSNSRLRDPSTSNDSPRIKGKPRESHIPE